jgi:hypothetical protein
VFKACLITNPGFLICLIQKEDNATDTASLIIMHDITSTFSQFVIVSGQFVVTITYDEVYWKWNTFIKKMFHAWSVTFWSSEQTEMFYRYVRVYLTMSTWTSVLNPEVSLSLFCATTCIQQCNTIAELPTIAYWKTPTQVIKYTIYIYIHTECSRRKGQYSGRSYYRSF